MEYTVVQEFYIDPDSIELEDFCNICKYVRKYMVTDSGLDNFILSVMTTDHIMNLDDTQLTIAYLPQKYNKYLYAAEIRQISPDGGEHWFQILPIVVELKILPPWEDYVDETTIPLAKLTVDGKAVYHLYKDDFDIILQEKKEENEEAPDSNDGNSGIREEYNN